MSYSAVGVYDLDGQFLGYSIREDGVPRLHTANLWTEDAGDITDLQAQLGRLNDAIDIRAYWPNVRDPEVEALLDDPEFQPLAMSAVEVVDEDNSIRVWIEEPDFDQGTPGILDVDNSHIAYKFVDAPAPADVKLRVKNACEIVARRRAAHG